jgi:hypothetical protein
MFASHFRYETFLNMNTKKILLTMTASLSAVAALAQSYSIDWFTIDGGGGTSTGGVYSISGTIGQPDAGTMSGGNYTLAGGFWAAIIPIQIPDAPTLFIQNLTAGSAKVTWMPNTSGFVLQEAGSLNATPVGWSNAPVAYTNGATIPAATQTRFFRLTKP